MSKSDDVARATKDDCCAQLCNLCAHGDVPQRRTEYLHHQGDYYHVATKGAKQVTWCAANTLRKAEKP